MTKGVARLRRDGSGEKVFAVARSLLPPPPRVASAGEAVGLGTFVLPGGLVDAHFVRRSAELMVTFDNLSSIGQVDPPEPWLQGRAAQMGVSILGIIARRKDWYRNPDTPALITALARAGLFAQFRRVTFVGASMGGFAALVYAPLVAGADVLAFSPQSTLARRRVRFERRYHYAQRSWDWSTPAHLDAAEAVAGAGRVTLVYDPFTPEDRQHAARLRGPNVNHIHAGHLGHRAIRMLKAMGALDQLIEGHVRGDFDALAHARAARARRGLAFWQRALLAEAERRGHLALAAAAARKLAAGEGGNRHGRRLAARLAAQAEGARSGQPLPQRAAPVTAAPGQGAPQQPLREISAADSAAAPPLPRLVEEEIHVTLGDPRPPFQGKILRLPQAVVVPERAGTDAIACGVLRSDGRYAELSRAWIRARKATPEPSLAPGDPVQDLAGRYLFGGHFRGHFGHFLVESTARLWALDHLTTPLDGILYLPYRGQVGPIEQAMKGHAGFFKALGIDLPLKTFGGAVKVDELILPELGFGWAERYGGSPAYRRFMMARLAAAAPPEGGERLYISRARLPAARGGVLGESWIEDNLARAGFEIFHPEKHPIEVQIARYRAARQVVALDGSALHLAAFLLPAAARVTMILRRSQANVGDYLRQYRGFLGITPAVVDVIRHDWVAGDATRADYRSLGELDFQRLFQRLADLGHLPAGFRPDLPSQAQILDMLEALQDRRGEPFRQLGSSEAPPDAQEAAA